MLKRSTRRSKTVDAASSPPDQPGSSPRPQGRAAPIRALEPRMVFDAAAGETMAEVNTATVACGATDAKMAAGDAGAAPAGEEVQPAASGDPRANAAAETSQQTSECAEAPQDPAPVQPEAAPRQELLVIDSRVPDLDVLLRGAPANAEVLLIDLSRDGIEQIAEALRGREGIDAIHILAHGTEGELRLGSGVLNADTLRQGMHAEALASLRAALSPEADILVYGCDFGEGEQGREAVRLLADATGADIAASHDATGHASLNADWDLEVHQGMIESGVAIDEAAQREWVHAFAPATITISGNPTVRDGAGNTIAGSNNAFAVNNNVLGSVATWANAGNVGGVTVSLRATVVAMGQSDDAVTFSTNGDDAQILLRSTNAATTPANQAAQLRVRWDLVRADNGQALAADINFQIADIDGIDGNTGPRESVTASQTGLTSFTTAADTHLQISTTNNLVRAAGTQNEEPQDPLPPSTIRYTWTNVSSWEITYDLAANNLTGAAAFSHDGDGDLVITNPATKSIPKIDLDANNSSGATGAGYQASYAENGAGIPIVDTDVTISNTGATVSSATVVLTNAQAGDVLSVGTLPTGITASQSTSGGVTTLTLTGARPAADYQTALRAISFASTSEAPDTSARLIDISVTSDGITGTAARSTIAVTSVNDAPVNTVPSAQTFDEDASFTFAGANAITVADLDAGATALTTTLSVPQGILTLGSTSGVTVTGNGTGSVTVTGTAAQITAALSGTVYTPPANYNGAVSLTVTTSDNGGTGTGGTRTDTDTVALTVAPVNDAPVNTVPGPQTINEDTSLTFAGVTAITVSDVDAGAGTLTTTLSVPQGILTLGSTSGVTVTGNGTGSVTVTGTAAQINAALGGTIYTPPANYNGALALTVATSDNGNTGSGGTRSDTDTVGITVTAVNDAPINTVPASQTINEDTTLTFTGATAITVSDVDAGAGTLTTTLSVPQGMLTLGSTSGVTVTGNGTGSVTVTGTAAQINAALNNTVYAPPANYNGAVTLTVTTSDNGNTGTGGMRSDTDTVGITVTAVNDAPVNTVPGPQTINEDATLTFVGATAITVADLDAGGAALTTTLSVPQGILTLGSTSGVTVTGNGTGTVTLTGPASQINAALNNTVYTPPANYNGAVTLTVTTSDNGNSGTGGTRTDTDTVALTVAAVNDAPTTTGLPNRSGIDATNASFSVAGSFADVDGSLTYSATGLPAGLSINGSTGVISGRLAANASQGGTGGVHTVTVRGTDAGGAFVETTFTYTVTNPAPTVAGTAGATVYVDTNANGAFNAGEANATFSNGTIATGTPQIDYVRNFDVPAGADPAATRIVVDITILDNSGTILVNGTNIAPTSGFEFEATNLNSTDDTNAGRTDTMVRFVGGGDIQTPWTGNSNGLPRIQFIITSAGVEVWGTRTASSTQLERMTLVAGNFVVPVLNAGQNTVTVRSFNDNGPDQANGTVRAFVDAPLNRSNADNQAVTFDARQVFNDVDGDSLTYTAAGLPPGLSINASTGQITGTLARNASQGGSGGVYTVTLTAADGNGGSATKIFTWTVTNPVPDAVPDTAATNEDTPVTITVLANDTDADGDALTVTAASAGRGSVTINADGTLRYTPAPNFNGTDTITYTISDSQGATATATVTVTVAAINDIPTADPIANRTSLDNEAINLPLAPFFTDIDGDPLSYTATNLPPGLAIDAATGRITGTLERDASRSGPYAVTVTASDGKGGSVQRSFSWAVTNPAPDAIADAVTIVEDTAITIAVLANDRDPDGDTLTITNAAAGRGSVTINPDGTLTYTPNPNFHGTDTISYRIVDAQGAAATASVTITVTPVNDAPTADPLVDRASLDNEAVSLPLGPFFADADGQTLTYTATGLPPGLTLNTATGLIEGTLTRNASQGGTGGTYTVAVTAADGTGGTVSRSFSWRVTNPFPDAAPDTAGTTEDTPVTISVLTNDTDPDGDTLSVTAASASHGAVIINADGTLRYAPAPNFHGSDTITYTIADGNGGTATASVTVTVAPANDAPTAIVLANRTNSDGETKAVDFRAAFSDLDGDALTFSAANLPPGLTLNTATGLVEGTVARNASLGSPYTVTIRATDPSGESVQRSFTWTILNPAPDAVPDTASVAEDDSVTISVLGNDIDPDGDTLSVTAAQASRGSVTINADGTLTYTPNPNFHGTDTITYAILDGNGGTATASVTVVVNPVNDTPTADPILADRANQDGRAVNVPLGPFFSDLDGDTLSFSATGLPPGLAIDAVGRITGTLTRDASQSNGGTYTVAITASDGNGGSVQRSFTWTVTNPAPDAAADTAATSEDGSVTVVVLANDLDPDGDALTVSSAFAGNGSVAINANGTLTYTPSPNFNGTDTITYTISDGNGGTATASVTVTVAPVNDAPTADLILANRTNLEGEAKSVDFRAVFADVDGDTLSFSATGLPPGLTIDPTTGRVTGTVSNTASQGSPYTVIIRATDPSGESVQRSFTWTILNPAPDAVPDGPLTTNEDTAITINVLANDTDPDGDTLTVTAASAPRGNVAINANGTLTYTPNPNFHGTDTITYAILDGNGGTATASVTVVVNPVNDTPAVDEIASRASLDNEAINLPLGSFFSDVDGTPLSFSATGLPPGLTLDTATGRITGTLARDASQSNGGTYTVTITASDGQGGSVAQTFAWTVTNPAPSAFADGPVTTNEDTAVTVSVLANDLDSDGDTLTITAASAPHGTVAINADGTLTYTPNTNFHGEDTITYTISDGNGGYSTTTVPVTVTPVNDAPTATPAPELSSEEGRPVSFTFAPLFADVDGDALTYSAIGLPPGVSIDSTTGRVSGTLASNASTGSPYAVTITASDGNGGTASTDFSWQISDLAPRPTNDAVSTPEGQSVEINVLANDADPRGTGLTVTTAQAAHGTVTIGAGGALTYTPIGDFNGPDRILYTVSDGTRSATAMVDVTVTPVNDAPVAGTIPTVTSRDAQFVSLPLGAYFSDLDAGDTRSFSATGLPAGLTIDPATGEILGTLARDASQGGTSGTYNVTVTVADTAGSTASTGFSWRVVNPAPDAFADTLTLSEDGNATINVLTNDTDPDGDTLAVTSASAGNGRVEIQANGTLLYYAPDSDYTGADTITYTVSDGNGGFATATVSVSVTPVNDAPAAQALVDRANLDGEAVVVPLAPFFSDIDRDALTFSATGLPAGLTINATTGEIAGNIDKAASTAMPVNGYVVRVTASDGQSSVFKDFRWVVANPAPDATPDTATTTEDMPVTITVVDDDIDPDADALSVTSASASHGVVVVNADGTLTYTPVGNFNGADTITYTISDGQGGFATATVDVTILPTNDAPTTDSLPVRTSLDGETLSLPLAPFFSDIDRGDTRSYSAAGLPPGLTLNAATGTISGTLTANASQGGAGGVYEVKVRVTDGAGAFAETTFDWRVTNTGPRAIADTLILAEDQSATINVLANDLDTDGDTLTIVPNSAFAGNGTVTIQPDGTLLYYAPDANYTGADTITYTVTDGNGGLATATVTVTVTPVNDAPTATAFVGRTNQDGEAVSLAVAAQFADIDGDILTYIATGLPPGLTIDTATGQITGTIDKGASAARPGGAYTVTITARDPSGAEITQAFTWTVTNPAPDAVPDTATTAEDTPVTINALANDTDTDGDTLAIVPNSASAGHGAVTINASGTLTYTPNTNFTGTDTITYTIADGDGGSATATVTVTVTPANDAPTAAAGAPRVNRDAEGVILSVAALFSDLDGDGLTYQAANLPPGLSLDPATGLITGTLAANASGGGTNGAYTVTLSARDPSGQVASTSFTWTVTNPAPDARADTLTLSEDGNATINVLANDLDPDGDVLTLVPGSAAAGNGRVEIQADGTLLYYAPDANYAGPDTITYTVTDGEGGFATATVTVTVQPLNDAPTLVALSDRASLDNESVSLPLRAFAADVDAGDTLTLAVTGLPPGLTFDAATGRIEGTLDRAASQGGAGGVYTVTVAATDGAGARAERTFTWTITNPAPDAWADAVTSPEDGSITINVLSNDVDADGDTLTVTQASAGNGTVAIQGNGTLVYYASDPNYFGTDTISYTVSDGQGGFATATVTVTVTPVNDAPTAGTLPARINQNGESIGAGLGAFFQDVDRGDRLAFAATGLPPGLVIDPAAGSISGTLPNNASRTGPYTVTVTATDEAGAAVSRTFTWTITGPSPEAVDDAATTLEDVPVTIDVLANDRDLGTATIVSASAGQGSVTINPDGTLTYRPAANAFGTDTITYAISDGQGGNGTAQVTVTVTPVNDAPIRVATLADQAGTDGAPVDLVLPRHVSEVDGDPLVYSAVDLPPGLSIDPATGRITGTLAADASLRSPYTVGIVASDGKGGDLVTTFTWTIANPAPTAADDAAATAEDVPVTLDVRTNDADADGDRLSVIAATALHGRVTANPDGTITYAPDANFHGSDTITYTISDGNGGTATASVAVTVTSVNDAPTANAPADRTDLEGEAQAIDFAPLFRDADGDALTFSATGLPPGLSIDPATGLVAGTVTTNASQGSPYVVSISAADGNGGSVTRTFNWTVTNPAPTAVADAVTTNEDTPVTINVLGNDVDPDADPLSIIAASAGNGSVAIGADGRLTYTPNGNFNGTDTITYTISDGQGGTATTTVTVAVTPVNDAPTAEALAARTDLEGEAKAIAFGPFFADGDGDALTFAATGLPPGLSIDPATGLVTGTVAKNASQSGPYAVTIEATDSSGAKAQRSFTWSVTNPVPDAVPDTAATNEDTPVTITVLANDTDADGDALTVTAASAGRGSVTINADGTLRYTPAPNFNGTDTITYTISDSQGATATATVTVTVAAVNDAPAAEGLADQSSLDADTVSIALASFFADADGQALTYAATGLPPGLSLDAVTGRIAGTLTRDASQGSPYAVSISAANGNGGSVTRTFAWAVANPAPSAAADDFAVDEDSVFVGTLLANDSDPDGDGIRIDEVPVSGPSQGSLVLRADGTFTYTPDPGATGKDSFRYQLRDADGATQVATVTITINAVNEAPRGTAAPARTTQDKPVTGEVTASDPDGDRLAFELAQPPASGSVVLQPGGRYLYVPEAGFSGNDLFRVRVSDGRGGSLVINVPVIVAAAAPTPVERVDPVIPPTAPAIVPLAPAPRSFELTPLPSLTAQGAVVDAVRGIGSLKSTAEAISADGAVVAAVNNAGSLGGATALDAARPIITQEVNRATPRGEGSLEASQDHGQPWFSARPFLGRSVDLDAGTNGGLSRAIGIQVEAIRHHDALVVNFRDLAPSRTGATVVEYRLTSADGRPLPAWLERGGASMYWGRPPANAQAVELVAEFVMSDGTVVKRSIRIDVDNAEIRTTPTPGPEAAAPAPLFSEQAAVASMSLPTDAMHARLERALGLM
ncbi:Ig-like domain-containing protein [Methylobacterium iners]|uniref:Cadherin domain-containing protein n=1 Tax=Methylobacterium iners TaxID=418707 RepID=A0ABQ4RZ98_9HYPH|nr:Ig-like domain-containing protein [Methylobacterium iners]GJD94845.1 hypothetical protein OCOJLMKI_2051 [Methylobacterium iners]